MPEDSQGSAGRWAGCRGRFSLDFTAFFLPAVQFLGWGETWLCFLGGTARGSEPRDSAGISAPGHPSPGTAGGGMQGCWSREFGCSAARESSRRCRLSAGSRWNHPGNAAGAVRALAVGRGLRWLLRAGPMVYFIFGVAAAAAGAGPAGPGSQALSQLCFPREEIPQGASFHPKLHPPCTGHGQPTRLFQSSFRGCPAGCDGWE